MSAIHLYSYIIAGLYLITFFCFLLKWLTYKNQKRESFEKRFVSVIVAFKNESENLSSLLISITRQSYCKEKFEIILVDDYSEKSFKPDQNKYKGINLYLIKNKFSQGKKYALKTGIEMAKGEIILTSDADCKAGEKWLETVVSLIPDSNEFFLSLPVFFHSPKGFFSGLQSLEFSSLVGVGAASFAAGKPVMCNGANLAFSKSLFLRSFENLYPEIPTGDDIFLMIEARKEKNCHMLFAKNPEAIVLTNSSSSLREFLRQRKRWASKAIYYKDPLLIFLSAFIFLFNFSLLIYLITGIFIPAFLRSFLFLFLLKMIVDFIFLSGFLSFFQKLNLLKFFLPSQIIYPFYIVYSAITGIVKGLNYWNNDPR
jgi:cellulose synthase/poly-beta-1,6-N-acetylglucosamine synthase-like glycosyltransferase